MTEGPVRIGADVGGTFTDVVLIDGGGRVHTHKAPSTPPDYERGVLDAVAHLLETAGTGGGQVRQVAHGTTVATNAVLERRGARTALVTTRGFRDVLELRRIRAPQIYDLFFTKPPPLVERSLRIEVGERMAADGAGAGAARRAGPGRAGRPAAVRGRGVGGRLPAPLLRLPRPRAGHRRAPAPRAARGPGVAVVRGAAGAQGVRALGHDRGQRLRPSGDGALPAVVARRPGRPRRRGAAADHAVRRGPHPRGGRGLPPGLRPGVGAGRRGAGRGPDLRGGGRAEPDHPGHGRHHRQGLDHRGRSPLLQPPVRGRRLAVDGRPAAGRAPGS